MKRLLVILIATLCMTFSCFAGTQKTLPVLDVQKDSEIIELTEKNHTALVGEVNRSSIKTVISDLVNRDPSKEFYIYIESPGGSVMAGLLLVDYLATQKNITCVASFAASMAFSILQACPTRIVTPSAVIMQHEAYQIADGKQTSDDAKTSTNILVQMNDLMATFEAKRLGISKEKFLELIKHEYWLIGSVKILHDNAADESKGVVCGKDIIGKTKTITVMTPFGPGDLTQPLCPLTN